MIELKMNPKKFFFLIATLTIAAFLFFSTKIAIYFAGSLIFFFGGYLVIYNIQKKKK